MILVSGSRRQSFEWANELASEHLTIDAEDIALVRNAGSVFVGDYSPQAAGDYASGPNHVLPTGAGARFRGGLSVLDFVKLISVQRLSRPGLRSIAPVVAVFGRRGRIAGACGFHPHKGGPCLKRGKRFAICPLIIRRLVVATVCAWTSTKTRQDVRREC